MYRPLYNENYRTTTKRFDMYIPRRALLAAAIGDTIIIVALTIALIVKW